jgi:hypothetical protein
VSDNLDACHNAAVVVPLRRLSAEGIRRVVEEVVTRDGTDYGAVERTLEEKIRDVTRQLEHGEVVIVYDHASATASIVTCATSAQAARGPRRRRGTVTSPQASWRRSETA